jgi:hypothetical protein
MTSLRQMLESCEKRPRGKKDARRAFRSQPSACSQQTERSGTGKHPHARSPAAPATVTSRLAYEGALAACQGLGDHASRSSCHPVNEKGLTCSALGGGFPVPRFHLWYAWPPPACFSHDSNICRMNATDGAGSMQYLLPHISLLQDDGNA